MEKLYNFFKGRHSLYIISAFGIGTLMAWFHRLDANLVTLLLGLGALVLGHSTKEDLLKSNQNAIHDVPNSTKYLGLS